MYNVFSSNIHLCMHWVKYVQKRRCQDVDNDYFGGVRITDDLGDASCMLFRSFANCLQSAYRIMMKGKPYERACLPSQYVTLTRPAFLCRGILEPLSLPPLCVTFQNTGALTWPWARRSEAGGVTLMSPAEGPLFFGGAALPSLRITAPPLEKVVYTPFAIFCHFMC